MQRGVGCCRRSACCSRPVATCPRSSLPRADDRRVAAPVLRSPRASRSPGALRGGNRAAERRRAGQLCLGGVRTSNPPQCEGPPIAGWQWSGVESEQRSDGVTWGTYVVVGTFDGSAFTPTRRPSARRRTTDRGCRPEETPRRSPCPVPEGGWRVPDPAPRPPFARADAARGLRPRGVRCAWSTSPSRPCDDRHQNDPRRLVLNVAVTGDRRVGGGEACGRPGAARCACPRPCTARRTCARAGPARRRALGARPSPRARPGRPAGGLRRRDLQGRSTRSTASAWSW